MSLICDSFLNKLKYTYDYKKTYVSLKYLNINLDCVSFDTMIAASLLDYNVKDDIAYLSNVFNYETKSNSFKSKIYL